MLVSAKSNIPTSFSAASRNLYKPSLCPRMINSEARNLQLAAWLALPPSTCSATCRITILSLAKAALRTASGVHCFHLPFPLGACLLYLKNLVLQNLWCDFGQCYWRGQLAFGMLRISKSDSFASFRAIVAKRLCFNGAEPNPAWGQPGRQELAACQNRAWGQLPLELAGCPHIAWQSQLNVDYPWPSLLVWALLLFLELFFATVRLGQGWAAWGRERDMNRRLPITTTIFCRRLCWCHIRVIEPRSKQGVHQTEVTVASRHDGGSNLDTWKSWAQNCI